MAQLEVKVDTKGLDRLIKRAPLVLSKWITLAFKQHGEVYRTEMNKRFQVGVTGGNKSTGIKIQSRTGALQKSVNYTVLGGATAKGIKNLSLILHVGDANTIRYAETQENGRVIVGNPYLAIPLPPNKTASGKVRIERPGLVRGQKDWLIYRSKKGNLLIGKKLPDGSIENHWILVRRVKVPPRLGFAKTVRGKKLTDDRIKRVNAAVKRGLKELK